MSLETAVVLAVAVLIAALLLHTLIAAGPYPCSVCGEGVDSRPYPCGCCFHPDCYPRGHWESHVDGKLPS